MVKPDILLILFTATLIIIVIAFFVAQESKLKRKLEAENLEKKLHEQELVRLRLEEVKKLKEKAVIEGMHQEVLTSNRIFSEFISFKDGYFNNNKLSIWKASVNSLYNELRKYKIETVNSGPC